MFCKTCNTPLSKHARACPSCGRSVGGSLGDSGLHEQRAPTGGPLSRSTAMDEGELPLDDAIEPEDTAYRSPPRDTAEPPASPKPRDTAEPPASPKPRAPSRPAPRAPATPADGPWRTRTAQASPRPSPTEVRALLAEKPALVAPGLSAFHDDQGRPAGVGLDTEVGRIDLLASDDSGALVVVTVAEDEKGKDLVADALQRIGWVRKHRAKSGQEVRGIVLLAEVPEDLVYSAAAVSDKLSFRIYRMSVAFDEVTL